MNKTSNHSPFHKHFLFLTVSKLLATEEILMELKLIDQSNFEYYKKALLNLYVATFSEGASAQFVDPDSTIIYMHEMLETGNGILALVEDDIAGALFITGLSFDKSLPENIAKSFPIDQSVYINEVMVDARFRRQGIGKLLMDAAMQEIAMQKSQYCFIRVWEENIPAVELYQKAGFKEIAKFEDHKFSPDKSTVRIFPKIYMFKEISA